MTADEPASVRDQRQAFVGLRRILEEQSEADMVLVRDAVEVPQVNITVVYEATGDGTHLSGYEIMTDVGHGPLVTEADPRFLGIHAGAYFQGQELEEEPDHELDGESEPDELYTRHYTLQQRRFLRSAMLIEAVLPGRIILLHGFVVTQYLFRISWGELHHATEATLRARDHWLNHDILVFVSCMRITASEADEEGECLLLGVTHDPCSALQIIMRLLEN